MIEERRTQGKSQKKTPKNNFFKYFTHLLLKLIIII